MDDRAQQILNFWFGAPGSAEYGAYRPAWFETNAAFDEEIRQRFLADYQRAAAGQLEHWKETPEECLALILLLDQFSRNLFREDGRAFATDPRGLDAAEYAVSHGYDRALNEMQRWFLYLPFEHSEDLEKQNRSVELFGTLTDTPTNRVGIDFAQRHRRVIERFGRFPHRNAVLGRESTAAELEFLAGPDAPF